jgi:transcriptional regulator with XRE-family HTH domain
MPAPSPRVGPTATKALKALGERVRMRRKALGLSSVTTSEAAGMSRVTLHRIERGEPSVAMGAYAGVIDALGLTLDVRDPKERRPSKNALPTVIRPADYPQLEKLTWQLKKDQRLSPSEALALYERNWRHVDQKNLAAKERKLIDALLEAFERERLLVRT